MRYIITMYRIETEALDYHLNHSLHVCFSLTTQDRRAALYWQRYAKAQRLAPYGPTCLQVITYDDTGKRTIRRYQYVKTNHRGKHEWWKVQNFIPTSYAGQVELDGKMYYRDFGKWNQYSAELAARRLDN